MDKLSVGNVAHVPHKVDNYFLATPGRENPPGAQGSQFGSAVGIGSGMASIASLPGGVSNRQRHVSMGGFEVQSQNSSIGDSPMDRPQIPYEHRITISKPSAFNPPAVDDIRDSGGNA